MTASLTFSRPAVPTDRRLGYELDDGHLVEQHLKGDRQAFGALVDRYQTRLLNFVNRTIGDRDRAEALVQEVFIRAFRHLHGFDPSKTFAIYIYTIASNVARNEPFRRSSSADGAAQCVGQLPEPLRTVFVLRELEGKSYQEIAEIAGCNVGTVKTRLRRARNTFAQLIQPLLRVAPLRKG
jgi:RNA polymerase sigma-70 factor (ECF subfamily)